MKTILIGAMFGTLMILAFAVVFFFLPTAIGWAIYTCYVSFQSKKWIVEYETNHDMWLVGFGVEMFIAFSWFFGCLLTNTQF